jgi:hypothetical protein
MSLVVKLNITTRNTFTEQVHLTPMFDITIRRLEELDNPNHPHDEVHAYEVTSGEDGTKAKFRHRYGDGAERCLEKALTALRVARQAIEDGAFL